MTVAVATRRSLHKTIKAALNEAGQVEAVISTFDVIDTDGDVVRASAFTDGQEVPMVWAHDWGQPVGKGVIRVEQTRAVFSGSFFMETAKGKEAYETVKAMGGLQEWSWGFRITEADIAPPPDGMEAPKLWTLPDGKVQYITGAEVFEVSPVLVGANRQTGTLGIKAVDLARMKAADALQTYMDEPNAEHAAAAIQALTEAHPTEEQNAGDDGKQPEPDDWTEQANQVVTAAESLLSDCN